MPNGVVKFQMGRGALAKLEFFTAEYAWLAGAELAFQQKDWMNVWNNIQYISSNIKKYEEAVDLCGQKQKYQELRGLVATIEHLTKRIGIDDIERYSVKFLFKKVFRNSSIDRSKNVENDTTVLENTFNRTFDLMVELDDVLVKNDKVEKLIRFDALYLNLVGLLGLLSKDKKGEKGQWSGMMEYLEKAKIELDGSENALKEHGLENQFTVLEAEIENMFGILKKIRKIVDKPKTFIGDIDIIIKPQVDLLKRTVTSTLKIVKNVDELYEEKKREKISSSKVI